MWLLSERNYAVREYSVGAVSKDQQDSKWMDKLGTEVLKKVNKSKRDIYDVYLWAIYFRDTTIR